MKISRLILAVLLAALVFGMWLTIIYQSAQPGSRRIPEERLIELLVQSHLNERRLTILAAHSEDLTSRTQAILDRLVPKPLFTPCHEADEPLVLYEAEPAVKPAKKGKRK